MTNKKTLAMSAITASLLMAVFAVSATPQAYATVTKSATTSIVTCVNTIPATWKITITTPPTTQAKFNHQVAFPVAYESAPADGCRPFGFQKHTDITTDNTQVWAVTKTTTQKDGTVTYSLGKTINFGDSVRGTSQATYKHCCSTALKNWASTTGNFIAN